MLNGQRCSRGEGEGEGRGWGMGTGVLERFCLASRLLHSCMHV